MKKIIIFFGIIILLASCSSSDTKEEPESISEDDQAMEKKAESSAIDKIKKIPLTIDQETIKNLPAGKETETFEYEAESEQVLWGIDELDPHLLSQLKSNIQVIAEQSEDPEILLQALVYYAGTPYHGEVLAKLENYKPDFQEPYLPTPETVTNEEDVERIDNSYILLDASSSMLLESEGEATQRMIIAQEAVNSFAKTIGKSSKVSLVAFGHKGDQSDAGKEKSCAGIEEVYPLDDLDSEKFYDTVSEVDAKGWTPLAEAIKRTNEWSDEEKGNTTVYIVSDGVETCDGDPVKAAQEFTESSDANKTVNIIGFQVDQEAEEQLTEVAKAGNGTYYAANNSKELQETIEYEWLPSLLSLAWAPVNLAPDGWEITHKTQEISDISQDWTAIIRREDHRFQSVLSSLREENIMPEEVIKTVKQKLEKRKEAFQTINDSLRESKKDMVKQEAEDIKIRVEDWVKEMEKLREKAS